MLPPPFRDPGLPHIENSGQGKEVQRRYPIVTNHASQPSAFSRCLKLEVSSTWSLYPRYFEFRGYIYRKGWDLKKDCYTYLSMAVWLKSPLSNLRVRQPPAGLAMASIFYLYFSFPLETEVGQYYPLSMNHFLKSQTYKNEKTLHFRHTCSDFDQLVFSDPHRMFHHKHHGFGRCRCQGSLQTSPPK